MLARLIQPRMTQEICMCTLMLSASFILNCFGHSGSPQLVEVAPDEPGGLNFDPLIPTEQPDAFGDTALSSDTMQDSIDSGPGGIDTVFLDSVDPVESVDQVESVDPVDPVESVASVDQVESVDPVESVASVDQVDSAESVDSVEPPCVLNTCGECAPPIQETCNEIDDNCNGKIDEGFDDDDDTFLNTEDCGSLPTIQLDCDDANPLLAQCLGVTDCDDLAQGGICLERFLEYENFTGSVPHAPGVRQASGGILLVNAADGSPSHYIVASHDEFAEQFLISSSLPDRDGRLTKVSLSGQVLFSLTIQNTTQVGDPNAAEIVFESLTAAPSGFVVAGTLYKTRMIDGQDVVRPFGYVARFIETATGFDRIWDRVLGEVYPCSEDPLGQPGSPPACNDRGIELYAVKLSSNNLIVSVGARFSGFAAPAGAHKGVIYSHGLDGTPTTECESGAGSGPTNGESKFLDLVEADEGRFVSIGGGTDTLETMGDLDFRLTSFTDHCVGTFINGTDGEIQRNIVEVLADDVGTSIALLPNNTGYIITGYSTDLSVPLSERQKRGRLFKTDLNGNLDLSFNLDVPLELSSRASQLNHVAIAPSGFVAMGASTSELDSGALPWIWMHYNDGGPSKSTVVDFPLARGIIHRAAVHNDGTVTALGHVSIDGADTVATELWLGTFDVLGRR
jgi:hypothetical protein